MLIIGADHAGFNLKEKIKLYLKRARIPFKDVGTFSPKPVDYPDIAQKAALLVKKLPGRRGLLICGSGTGMCIAANKIKGIRAVSCESTACAKSSRQDDAAHILALGARILSVKQARQILSIWLKTKASRAERHQRRIKKIHQLEGSKWLK